MRKEKHVSWIHTPTTGRGTSTATHLKVFLVLRDDNVIDMCMTGSTEGTAPADQTANGKTEIYTSLNIDTDNTQLLLSMLPCPPHCGQGNGGTSFNGLDKKFITHIAA